MITGMHFTNILFNLRGCLGVQIGNSAHKQKKNSSNKLFYRQMTWWQDKYFKYRKPPSWASQKEEFPDMGANVMISQTYPRFVTFNTIHIPCAVYYKGSNTSYNTPYITHTHILWSTLLVIGHIPINPIANVQVYPSLPHELIHVSNH